MLSIHMNLQKNVYALWLCLVAYAPLFAQPNTEIAQLKKNYINAMLSTDEQKKPYLELLSSIPKEAEVSDQNVIELQQLYPITKREIRTYVRTIREDGSWPDIDYADTKRSGWDPKRHAERILKLVKYYYPRKEQPKQVSELVTTIHKAMNYWFTQKLVCKNWWYNQIGIPRTLGSAFLLFESEMSDCEKLSAVEVLLNAKFGMTGQNKVWLAGNVLMRALLQNDLVLVKAARDEIGSEIVLGVSRV